MNFRIVLLAIGGILIIESILLLSCLGFSLATESQQICEQSHLSFPALWLLCLIPTAITGILLIFFNRHADRTRIFRREAFAVVGLGWLIAGLFAALPYLLLPPHLYLWDALFESYSGLTTTGATIFKDLNQVPESLLLWRSVTQWMGGMGIVILFVAVMGFFGIGNKALFNRESSDLADSDMGTRFQHLSLRYLFIYLALTGIAFLGLVILGQSPFAALNHAMCAISTGGFSPHNESIAFYPQLSIQLWLTLIMLMGGIAFPLHYLIWIQRRYQALTHNQELKVYFAIIGFTSVIIAIDLIYFWPGHDGDLPRRIVESVFQSVSIMTTTGFGSANFDLWPPLSKTLLLGLMFIGGCAGSTAGGIKVSRFIVFVKSALRHIRLVQRPHRVEKLRLNGKVLSEDAIHGVIMYFALYFFLLLIGILGLAFLEPNLKLTSTFSALIACLNNIGPGLADVGPTENFALFNPFSKLWLAAFMLLGRLEIYAILLLLTPHFWRRFP